MAGFAFVVFFFSWALMKQPLEVLILAEIFSLFVEAFGLPPFPPSTFSRPFLMTKATDFFSLPVPSP